MAKPIRIDVVVICYKRTTHLQKVLKALSAVKGFNEVSVCFVVQGSNTEVHQIVRDFKSSEKTIIHTQYSAHTNPRRAINSNIHSGLIEIFTKPESEVCLVLEDDVVIMPDSLEFIKSVIRKYQGKRRFRGGNLYSVNDTPQLAGAGFIRVNFGLGQGWFITKETFHKLSKFWDGSEDAHWDYLIEPYVRTGFVIMPYHSRIINIGFDETATHSGSDVAFGQQIRRSAEVSNQESDQDFVEITEHIFKWRRDFIVLSELSLFSTYLLYLLRDIAFQFYRIALKKRPRIHYFWRKIRNFTDGLFI